MRQQVNLLAEELKPRTQPLTPVQLLTVWVALVGILMLVSGTDTLSLWQMTTQRDDASAQWETLRSVNSELKAGVSAADPILQQEVDLLRKRRSDQRRLMDLLFGYQEKQSEGFSPYLSDLAEHRIDGMWLQQITLKQGGSQIHLNGRTLDPEVVPRFLKQLSLGDSFRGHRFQQFELKENEQGLLEFDISNPEETSG